MTMLEIEKVKESKEYKALDVLADACNDFGFHAENFGKGISLQHRTLQQKLCAMAVSILKELANAESYDGRNESAVKYCKKLKESGAFDEAYFPCI